MAGDMHEIVDAIGADSPGEEIGALALPESMRAVTVHKDEVDMFEGVESQDKDPRKSIHLDEVPIPPLGPNEVLIANMAS